MRDLWRILSVFLVISLFSQSTMVSAQEVSYTILKIRNLSIPPNETFTTTVTVQPYAEHTLESEIAPTDISVIDEAVHIRLHNEWSLWGKNLIHRGDVGYRNGTWFPAVPEYELNITNHGQLGEVQVNFTLTQTGLPTKTEPSAGHLWFNMIGPLMAITIAPPVILGAVLLFYRRTRYAR